MRRQVRLFLGHLHGGVPEHFFDVHEGHAFADHPAGARVPQVVDAEVRDPGSAARTFEPLLIRIPYCQRL